MTAHPTTPPGSHSATDAEIASLVCYWNAANYLTVAQIYLCANPLLRERLQPEHIKPRLLGHWGTSPGLSLVYAHMNRLIDRTWASVIYITGPGHGGPALVANVYLEGTYSEVYPDVSHDEAGVLRLVRQFSTPGGIPSHVSVPTPGSIHEGGELGYALVHAFGAAFDNPRPARGLRDRRRRGRDGTARGLVEGRAIPQSGSRRRGAAHPALEREQDIAGGAIIIFEIVEWNVIGFAWLQAAYIGIGAVILGLATWVRMADVLLRAPENVPPRAAR
jgi:XFP N-terminal domain